MNQTTAQLPGARSYRGGQQHTGDLALGVEWG